jgi:formiminotetrahydrofolate cyclodeaminase
MVDSSADKRGLCDTATVREFLERAASGTPTPGGGGIAALVGAAAVSMLEMALNFTVGRPKFHDVEAEARATLAQLKGLRETLVDLVARDAEAYGEVSRAMKLPGASPAEKDARRQALDAAMRAAAVPPAEMVRAIRKAAIAAPGVLAIANKNLVGDVAVAAAILPGAANAAALNVWVNVASMADEEAATITGEIRSALSEIDCAAGAVFSEVKRSACPNRHKGSS